MNRDDVYLDCRIIRETDAAILIEGENEEDVWIPLSQVNEIVRGVNPDPDTPDRLCITGWIAAKRGLG